MSKRADAFALVSAPSPARRHRFVQMSCLFATLAHTLATLACVYIFRDGNFQHFSPSKLLAYVPMHLFFWKSTCLLVMLSSFSTLIFILASREIVEEKYRFLIGGAVVTALLACNQDISAVSQMMVLFADIAMQGAINGRTVSQELVQIGWTLINHSLTQTFMMSSFLFGCSGLIISYCLWRTRFLPRYLAWAHLPVWLVMIALSLTTFGGNLPLALALMFVANLGISFLAAFSGANLTASLMIATGAHPRCGFRSSVNTSIART